MSPETARRMNELARMTPDERREALAAEVMAPILDALSANYRRQAEVCGELAEALERRAARQRADAADHAPTPTTDDED